MNNLKESSTLQSKKLISERRSMGLPIFNGGLGENPFPLPEYMIKCLKYHSDKNGYNNPSGIGVLYDSIKDYHSCDNYHVNNVLVGNGLKELLYILLLSLKEDYKLYLITHCWL